MNGRGNAQYHYIVVGGGSAGSVLAARLSEAPERRVLLLESGSAEAHPLGVNPTAWPALWGSPVDYAYVTSPQAAMNGAEIPWPRGHTLGGSSAINGMVYLRGHRHDYDRWVQEYGAKGWSYAEVLPYLRRMETVPGADPCLRGQDGPMLPGRAVHPHPLSELFLTAASSAGYPLSADLNGIDAEAAGWNDLAIVNGRRQSAADAYLTPVLSRENLTVSTESRAVQLLFDRDMCTGVRYQRAGQLLESRAEAEVILCAGAVDSPRLLLLSGVGPAGELRAAGIEVHHDLPGVGRNLQDHPLTSVVYSARRAIPPGENNLAEVSMSWRSDGELPGPDMQMVFSHAPFHPPALQSPADSFTFCVATVPNSVGSIRLRSADPVQMPVIDPNYLGEERDLDRLVDGIEVIRDLASQNSFDEWRGQEVHPGAGSTTRNELKEFIRRATGSYFHPVGTCAMGSTDEAVVAPDLTVRGLRNLRIVDASVMPKLVSVNTNVATTMIGEYAADLVRHRDAM